MMGEIFDSIMEVLENIKLGTRYYEYDTSARLILPSTTAACERFEDESAAEKTSLFLQEQFLCVIISVMFGNLYVRWDEDIQILIRYII